MSERDFPKRREQLLSHIQQPIHIFLQTGLLPVPSMIPVMQRRKLCFVRRCFDCEVNIVCFQNLRAMVQGDFTGKG